MYNIELIIDKDLSFFLKKEQKQIYFSLSFSGRRSAKDLLESLGIPHVEIGKLKINDKPENLSVVLEDNDCVRVASIGTDNSYADSAGFLLDVHLGKLAVNLRLLGFDTDYSNDRDDSELERLAVNENRILLSCDRGLLMRRRITRGMVVRSREPEQQTVEVLCRYNLCDSTAPFTRCFNCGGILKQATLNDLSEEEYRLIPPKVKVRYNEYTRCAGCGQLYWAGSHMKAMRLKVNKIMEKAGTGSHISKKNG